jgi:hypothetical protein
LAPASRQAFGLGPKEILTASEIRQERMDGGRAIWLSFARSWRITLKPLLNGSLSMDQTTVNHEAIEHAVPAQDEHVVELSFAALEMIGGGVVSFEI